MNRDIQIHKISELLSQEDDTTLEAVSNVLERLIGSDARPQCIKVIDKFTRLF